MAKIWWSAFIIAIDCLAFSHIKAQPEGLLEDKTYQLIVIFSSRCCGIDGEIAMQLYQFLDSIQAHNYTEHWGKEGEKNVYIDLSSYETQTSEAHWTTIKTICQASKEQIVQIERRIYYEKMSQQLFVFLGFSDSEIDKEQTIYQVVQQMGKQLDTNVEIQSYPVSEDQRYIFRQCLMISLLPLHRTQQTELLGKIFQTMQLSK